MTRWTAIECSDFALYARFLAGEDLTPVLKQRSDLGFNLLRVWLLNTSVYRIVPSDWPDFYGPLPRLCDLCASFGLYVEYTCFTQTQTLMPSKAAQQAHLDAIGTALDGYQGRCLLSKVNEADQHDNRTADGLLMPPGHIWSNGSNGADAEPPTGGVYEEYHSNGLSEWQRKTGHNSFEWAVVHGSRCLGGENTRIPDQDDSEVHCFDAAAGASLLCLGACFHSVHGKTSELWTNQADPSAPDEASSRMANQNELQCAQAWALGALSVPLKYQPGQYRHETGMEGPDVLRAYSRTLPDGDMCVVKIRY